MCTDKETICLSIQKESIDKERGRMRKRWRDTLVKSMLCSRPESLGQFASFSGLWFGCLCLWMMLTVMFLKFLLVFVNRRVTAGCILLMRRSFREQTSCSQFSWAGAGDHQPICQWSLENIRYFNNSLQHCCYSVILSVQCSSLKPMQFTTAV